MGWGVKWSTQWWALGWVVESKEGAVIRWVLLLMGEIMEGNQGLETSMVAPI